MMDLDVAETYNNPVIEALMSFKNEAFPISTAEYLDEIVLSTYVLMCDKHTNQNRTLSEHQEEAYGICVKLLYEQ